MLFESESIHYDLYKEICSISPGAHELIISIIEELCSFNPSWLSFWIDQGFKAKIEVYLLRYVLPMNEIISPDGYTEMKRKQALASQLLSCVAWRAFDNCADEQHDENTRPLLLANSVMDLSMFICNHDSKFKLEILKDHFFSMTNCLENEKKHAIALEKIYTRCSIFLLPFDYLELGNKKLFVNYINYTGLAHDIHDYLSDHKSGTNTLPIKWSQDSNPNNVFSIGHVKALYQRVRKESQSLENEISTQIDDSHPVLRFFFEEAKATIYQ